MNIRFHTRRFASIVAVAILLLTNGLEANAQPLLPGLISECDFCLCSQGISPLEMGGSAIRFDTRYTELSHEFNDGVRVSLTGPTETFLTNQMSLTYGVTKQLSACLVVPYANKSEHFNDVTPGQPTSISNAGIGDVSLLGRYNIIADHTMGDTRILSVTAGVKFGNGSTSLLNADGSSADPDVQLGTGTTDFMTGTGFLLGFSDWSISTNVLAGIRGFGSGSNGHVYGNNLNYDVTARYRFYQNDFGNPMIFGALSLRGEWRGYELQDGERIGGSGGDVTYVAPGVQVFITPAISLDASLWLPVVYALHGDQVAETVKVLAGVQVGL